MAQRHFKPITIQADHGFRRVHRIQCSECPTTLDVPANTFSGARNHEDLNKTFQRKLWDVGRNPDRDLCPECAGMKRKAKRQATTADIKPKTATVIVMPTKNAETSAPALEVEAPREPTFADKRIISAKLEEVYVDEHVGYSADWTDQKVADALNCPWKWVADIREANFGPARNNEHIREQIAEARSLLDMANELNQRALKLQQDFTVFNRSAIELRTALEKTTSKVADLEAKVR